MEEENISLSENSSYTLEQKIDELNYHTSVIQDTGLFLVAFLVVILVCYLFYKSIDNFISF